MLAASDAVVRNAAGRLRIPGERYAAGSCCTAAREVGKQTVGSRKAASKGNLEQSVARSPQAVWAALANTRSRNS